MKGSSSALPNPAGEMAMAVAARPRPASSSTTRPPIELPTRWGCSRPSSSSHASRASTRGRTPRRSTGAAISPNPGRSTPMSSWWRLNARGPGPKRAGWCPGCGLPPGEDPSGALVVDGAQRQRYPRRVNAPCTGIRQGRQDPRRPRRQQAPRRRAADRPRRRGRPVLLRGPERRSAGRAGPGRALRADRPPRRKRARAHGDDGASHRRRRGLRALRLGGLDARPHTPRRGVGAPATNHLYDGLRAEARPPLPGRSGRADRGAVGPGGAHPGSPLRGQQLGRDGGRHQRPELHAHQGA